MKATKLIIPLVLILIIGIFLRIYKLGTNDLWFDEAMSIYSVTHLTDTPAWFFHYANPPLYYFFLRLWVVLWGSSEFCMRMLSVIFGIGSLWLVYQFAKKIFCRKVGLLSMLIFAISPVHIWYSQEVRQYTMTTFFMLATLYFFYIAVERNKRYAWYLFTICSIVSVYTTYYAFFMLPAEGACFFLRKYRSLLKKWLLVCCIILLAFSPWISSFRQQFDFVKRGFWIDKPSLKSIITTLENFNVGYSGTKITYAFSLIIYSLLFIAGIMKWKREKNVLWIHLSFLFVPLIVIFLISQRLPIYIDRQLIAFSPLYYILVADGIEKLKYATFKIFCILSLVVFSFLSLQNYYAGNRFFNDMRTMLSAGTYTKKPYKPAVHYLKERFRKGDIIAHSNYHNIAPFCYYGDFDRPDQYYIFIPEAEEKYQLMLLTGDRPFVDSIDLKKDAMSFNRIWLVFSSFTKGTTLHNNSEAVKRWMDEHYNKVLTQDIDGISINLYVARKE